MSDYFKKRMEELGLDKTGSSNSGKTTSAKSDNKTTIKSGSGNYFANRMKELGLNNSDVDDTYISSFFRDAQNFLSSAESDYNGITYDNKDSIYQSRKKTSNDLRTRSSKIRQYLDANKDAIGADSYNSLKAQLDDFDKANSSTDYAFYQAKKYGFDVSSKYTNMSSAEIKAAMDSHATSEEDKNIIHELMVSNMPYNREYAEQDGRDMGLYDQVEQKRKYISEKYGIQFTESSYENSQLLTSLMSGISNQPDSSVAYTTADGKNVTWQKLYDQKVAEEDLANRIASYSKNADWDAMSKGKDVSSDPNRQSDYNLVFELSRSNVAYDKETALANGTSEAEWNDIDQKRRYIGDKYGVDLYDDIYANVNIFNEIMKMLDDKAWERGELSTQLSEDIIGEQTFKNMRHLNEDEKAVLNYIFNTQGRDAALQWHNSRMNVYQDRANGVLTEEMSNLGKDSPVWGSVGSVALSLGSGVEYLTDLFDYMATGEAQDNTLARASSSIRSGVMETVDWEIGNWDAFDFVYSTGMSMADSAASMLVMGNLGGIGLGLSAAAQATNDALDRGMSNGQAFWNGLISGTFEGLFESWSIGKFDALKEVSSAHGWDIAKNIAKSMLVNASEETLTEVANIAYDSIFNGDFSQYETLVRQYVVNGYSEEEAKSKAAQDLGKQVVEAGASGLLMGFGFGAAGSTRAIASNAISSIQSAQQTNAIAKGALSTDGSVDALINLAKEVAGVSDTKMQNKINKQTGKVGNKATVRNVGKLYNTVSDAYNAQSRADIVKSLVRNNFSTNEADTIAEAMVNLADGQVLTNKQMTLLEAYEGNTHVKDAFNNIVRNTQSTMGQRNQELRDFAVSANLSRMVQQAKKRAEKAAKKGKLTTEEKSPVESHYEVSVDGKTIDINTGEEISIKGVKSIENGKMILETENGTIDASEVSFATHDESLVYSVISDMDVSADTAWSLINGFKAADGVSAQTYAIDVPLAYKYGKLNYKSGLKNLSLTTEQGMTAFFRGRTDAEAEVKAKAAAATESSSATVNENSAKKEIIFEGFTYDEKTARPMQKASIAAIDVINKMSNLEVHVYQSFKKNGKYYAIVNGVERLAPNGYFTDGNKIYIDINAGNHGQGAMLYTLSHEVGHYIAQWNAEDFKAISDFLFEHYGENVPMDSLLKAQKQKLIKSYEADGKAIPSDSELERMAQEELVCDMLSNMLADKNAYDILMELKQKDLNLFQKLGEAIKKLLDNLKALIGVYDNQSPDFQYAASVEMIGEKAFRELQDLYMRAFVQADANFQNSLAPGEEGIIVNENGDPVAHATEDGTVQLSMRTYEEEGRDAFRAYLEKCVKSKKLTKAEMQEMLDGIEEIYNVCKDFKDKYAPFGTWSDASVVRDTHGKPVFSVVTPNGEYKMNLDFSLVCKKRRALDAVFNEMSKRGIIDSFELGQKSVVKINEIIRKYGFETACALCFVDAKRFRQASMADSFTSLYNELVESLVPESQKDSIERFNFAGYETIKKVENGIHTWDNSKLDFSHINHVLKTYGDGTVEYKAAKYIKSHAEGRKLLLRGDFMSSQGFDAVKSQNPDVLKLYNSKKGTGGPKAAFGDVQYLNEVIQKARWWTPAKAYSVGGVRIQSFSDYVPRMVFDYVQMVYDLAATKLPAHAYTKEALFVKQFGLTGIKINMSLIPAIAEGGIAPGLDADGNYVWAGESFDYETAKEIQNAEGYTENCGTICVGVSYDHIKKLLADPNIRQVIPYHKSGLNPIVAHMNRIAQFTDYTSNQNTLDKEGKKVEKDFDFSKALHNMGENADPKAVADQYLKWCVSKGYTPKFAEFAEMDGYYKLLEDFTLYDKDGHYVPQREVRAVFPTESSAFGSMKSLIEAGLQEDAVIEGKRDANLSAIVDEIERTLPKTEAEIAETEVEQADRDLEEDAKYSIRDEFYKEYDAWDKKDTHVSFVTGATSDVLKSIGMKDQNIILRSGTVLQKIKDHPEITFDIFKGIPDLLEHPVIIQFSDAIDPKTKRPKYDSSITVLGELYADVVDEGKTVKKPVLVSLELLPTKNKGTTVLDFAIIKSAYSKNALQQYLNENSILYIDPDKKRTDSWLSLTRLQLPFGENRYGPIRKIAYVDGKVKVQNPKNMTEMQKKLFEAGKIDEFGNKLFSERDSDGNQLSKEQQEFFKDSKVRDAAGNLLVVYHGTPNGSTTIFDKAKTSKINDMGQGVYFSTDKSDASEYMGKSRRRKLYSAYVNIKAPFVVSDNVKITIAEAVSLLKLCDDRMLASDVYKEIKINAKDGYITTSQLANTNISQRMTEMLEKSGKYDGIIDETVSDKFGLVKGVKHIISLKSNQIKSVDNRRPTTDPDIRYSDRDNAPTFYSQMAKVVDGVKQEKLGASSVVNMLRGKGVKAEEIKWSGIETWLEGKKSVTKAELQEFIAGSMLQIGEQTSGISAFVDEDGNTYTETEFKARAYELADEQGIDRDRVKFTFDGDEMYAYVGNVFSGEILSATGVNGARWSKYKLDGGENYREIVFTLPNSSYSNQMMRVHWGEDAEGVLAHARIQDFNTFIGKMLFIEEIQSDYHNEGHQSGYADSKTEAEIDKLKAIADERFFAMEDYSTETTGMAGEWEAIERTVKGSRLLLEYLEARDAYDNAMNEFVKKIPDAPFRDAYHEYVMKRLIRMAAEQDYDSIGWTTAETQGKRWSEDYAEGYRIEYDQDIPKFMTKYGKKWGTKVGKTVLDNGTEVWSMAITDSMKESVLTEGQPLYQDRDTDSVSNRSLLANAFEGVAQNDIEKQKIQEYKEKIDLIDAEEQKLHDLNEQIKELSFSKGPRDAKKIRDLQFEARQTANRISTYDKQLLRLEASKPLQDVLTREKKMAYQRAEKKGKEALANYKEKAAKTQRDLLEKWQESRKKGIDSRHRTAMRHKIKDVVNELNQYLLRGTKDRHVPIELQKAVAEALDAVNMDTVGAEERIAKLQAELMKAKTPEQIQEVSRKIDHIQEMGDKMNGKLKKLKDAYDQFVNSDDPLIANSHDEVISNKLQSVIESIGNTPLRDMTLTQLEDVYDMYRMVLTTIRNANKAFKAKKSESISVIANQVMMEVEKVGGKNKLTRKGMEGIKSFVWNNLKPVYAFEHIGSSSFTEVFNNVRDGEDVWAVDVTEAREYYLDKSKKHNYDSWDFKKRFNFKSASGMDFSLNLEQIMSLYAYSKRDQAADHLKKGGIVIDETTEITIKNKLGIPVKFNPTEATAYNISEETLADIISKLSDEQKSFVDEMQDYLSTVMGAKGNEVSLEMYGVKLFKEKFYFPLKSAQQFMAKAKEQQKGEVKIKNSGFSKETVQKASNPIVLTPFMNVWADHVNEMSMYHAFVLPMEDFYRVYNYKTPTSETMATESVEMFIQNAYGKGATKYIDQLLKDLNGGARTDSTTGFINKMMGLFKKGAVFASLSVVVQQPSAIARATALVDTKYFIGHKVDHKRHKALWDEVKQYAPVAIIKEMGYFDTNMGKSTQDFILGKEYSGFSEKMKALVTDSGYRDEVLSKAPALADELAWCSIWEAVKRETKAKNPGMDVKSEAFLKKAGERFTEVITKTQVYDSVLSRSGMMRSKDTGMKMATAFMAEPTTSINMIADALLQGKRGNKKHARGAIGAVIAAQLLNSILVSFVYAGRDDDEDETYVEKYIGTFTAEVLDGLNPATYIPFIKDIVSIVQGYDVERSDMAVISDLWKAWENLSKDNVSVYRKVEGFAGSIAQIFGLPVKNIMRDVRGIYQTIDSFVNGQATTGAGVGYAAQGAITGKTAPDYQQLYEAYLRGDTAHIERVKGRFEDQTAINNAIRKALRENDPRVRQAAIAWNANDLDEYMRIAKEIIAEKHFVQDDVVMAIRSEANSLKPDDGASGTSKAKGLFTAEKFAEAIAQGDQASAYAAKMDIIETAKKNGKTAEDAEDSFVSSAKNELKELFMAGDISEQKAINAIVTYCGKTEDEAMADVKYWAFKKKYPTIYADDQWFDTYYEKVADSGIAINVYMEYRNTVSTITGEGKKERRMDVIDSLPISNAQKDALYFAEGWTESKLHEAPWH